MSTDSQQTLGRLKKTVIESLENGGPEDAPFMSKGAKSYTRGELIAAITKGEDIGNDVIANIIDLTVDLITRKKINADLPSEQPIDSKEDEILEEFKTKWLTDSYEALFKFEDERKQRNALFEKAYVEGRKDQYLEQRREVKAYLERIRIMEAQISSLLTSDKDWREKWGETMMKLSRFSGRQKHSDEL